MDLDCSGKGEGTGENARTTAIELNRIINPDKQVAVRDLKVGDMVDLQDDPYADKNHNPFLECEYVIVAKIESETPDCVAVWFEGFDCVGFPPDHQLKVGGHDSEYTEGATS